VRNDNSIIKNPVQYPLTGLEVNDVDESNGTAEQCVFNLIAAVNHEPATNDRGLIRQLQNTKARIHGVNTTMMLFTGLSSSEKRTIFHQ
jgi:hypothetical protein